MELQMPQDENWGLVFRRPNYHHHHHQVEIKTFDNINTPKPLTFDTFLLPPPPPPPPLPIRLFLLIILKTYPLPFYPLLYPLSPPPPPTPPLSLPFIWYITSTISITPGPFLSSWLLFLVFLFSNNIIIFWLLDASSSHFWWPETIKNLKILYFDNINHLQNLEPLSLIKPLYHPLLNTSSRGGVDTNMANTSMLYLIGIDLWR